MAGEGVFELRIKVLGSAGSEVPGHSCPAFLIDGTILVDAGTIAPALNISEEQRLAWILLTHVHFDHIKGMPFLLHNLVTRGTGTAVTVLGAREVLADLRRNIFNDRIWPDFSRIPSPGRPALRYRAIGTARPCTVDGYRVTMEKVRHSVPAYGFIVEKGGSRSIAYTGDTGPTGRFWKRVAASGAEHLIVEASFPNRLEELALESGHLTPSLLEREIAKMPRAPANIYVTHLKAQFRREIAAEIGSLRCGNVRLLNDGDVIRV